MPDTNQTPAADTASGTTPARKRENPNNSSAPASSASGGGDTGVSTLPGGAVREVHAVMQGKGGVGKTYVAGLIAQWLIERGEPVACLDTDPVNASFCDLRALNVSPVALFKDGGDEVDVDAMDAMVERFLSEDSHFVVDNGAASFVPLSRYLVQDGIADTIASAGKKLVVHAVVAGGQELVQTAKGFDSIASQFPASADVVLWLNEHHGSVDGRGAGGFEATPLYRKHEARIRGVVRLARLHQPTFGANVSAMLSRGMTFAEALDSPEFFVVAKQRRVQVKRAVFEQLAPVLAAGAASAPSGVV